MAFNSIGTLAGDVLLKVEDKRAAALNRAAQIKGGGRSAGRGSDQPPALFVDAPTPSGSNEKVRGRAPAVGREGHPSQDETSLRGVRRGRLVLISSRDRCTAPPTNRSRPTPAVHLSLVLNERGHRISPMT